MSAHREAAELYRRRSARCRTTASPAGRAELLTALAAELAAVDDNAGAARRLRTAYRLHLERATGRPRRRSCRPGSRSATLGAGLEERVAALRAAVALIEDVPGGDEEVRAVCTPRWPPPTCWTGGWPRRSRTASGPVDPGRGRGSRDAVQPRRDAGLGAALRRPDGRGPAADRGRGDAGRRWRFESRRRAGTGCSAPARRCWWSTRWRCGG